MPELYLLFLLFTFLLFTGVKLFSLWIKKGQSNKVDLTEVAIIIPFRNEVENLPIILNSLSNQSSMVSDVLFVDDHSTDKSTQLIVSFIESNRFGRLLSLSGEFSGKKAALNFGISNTNARFILTLDADVELNKNYFKSLQKLNASGLVSLPVLMNGKGFLGRLFSTEYSFFNAFSYLWSSIWPISVSGANLLFDTKSIDYQKQLQQHEHLSSGDDYFLLKKFREEKQSIHISNNYNLSVITEAPSTLKAYFGQRVRWLGKSKFQLVWMDAILGFFISFYFLGGFLALIISLFFGQWQLFVSIFLLRLMIDASVYLNYGQRLRITKNVMFLPFFQLLYPLMFIGVLMLSWFWKPIWKGRRCN